MNLRQLEVFQAVLQTGNMSAAARLLCRPPGPSLDAVRAVLTVRGPKDPAAAQLAAAL